MAEGARHGDAIRLHQIARLVVARVAIVPFGVPLLARLCVERRIREQSQANDARGLAVVRADRNGAATGPDLNPLVLVGVGERVSGTGGVADVEPETVAVRVGAGRLAETRFVDEPEKVPARIAGVRERRMRRERLEKVERSQAPDREHVPEPVVAAGPDNPHVAPLDLLPRQRQAAVHVAKVVFVRSREAGCGPPREHRLVAHGAGCSAPCRRRRPVTGRWRARHT